MIKVVKKTTKGDITGAILQTVKVAGFLSIMTVAPNVLQIFGKRGLAPYMGQRGIINRARDILLRNGCMAKNPQGFLRLTEKGEQKLRKYKLSNYELVVPRIWDKKWRVLIFDIPEHRKSLRDKIRSTLVSIGFIRVQDSVWIFPYDCAELVALLKADFKVGKDLLYMVVNSIENDREIKEFFGL